jgi:hypothetical protein
MKRRVKTELMIPKHLEILKQINFKNSVILKIGGRARQIKSQHLRESGMWRLRTCGH